VARFQRGEPEAFVLLYEQFSSRVRSYLEARLRCPHDAQDVGQQVFMKVFEALPAYRVERRPFRHWLFRIAHNAAEDHRRKFGRTARVALDEGTGRGPDEAGDGAPAWGSSANVHDALDELAGAQRQVLVLIYRWDLSAREAGIVLGRPEATVRKLHSRALAALQARLRRP
jgi:RNA polymerase sigma factor (sigma-70 family)